MPKVVKFINYGITWELMGVNGKIYANHGNLNIWFYLKVVPESCKPGFVSKFWL